mmetsp:Transcript_12928/g.36467  ORF Transcript_12928/g.36467 Transcript_12928/m.36467 type:complete len:239 (+) Transcript_12928:617-1333(+)
MMVSAPARCPVTSGPPSVSGSFSTVAPCGCAYVRGESRMMLPKPAMVLTSERPLLDMRIWSPTASPASEATTTIVAPDAAGSRVIVVTHGATAQSWRTTPRPPPVHATTAAPTRPRGHATLRCPPGGSSTGRTTSPACSPSTGPGAQPAAVGAGLAERAEQELLSTTRSAPSEHSTTTVPREPAGHARLLRPCSGSGAVSTTSSPATAATWPDAQPAAQLFSTSFRVPSQHSTTAAPT